MSNAKFLPDSAYKIGMKVQVRTGPNETAVATVRFLGTGKGNIRIEIDSPETLKEQEQNKHAPFWIESRHLKPIVRKIQTITEDEARELFKAMTGNTFKPKPYDWIITARTAKQDWLFNSEYLDGISQDEYERITYSVKAIDWLDANGFDIRGWIEKGFAIDAATIKTQ